MVPASAGDWKWSVVVGACGCIGCRESGLSPGKEITCARYTVTIITRGTIRRWQHCSVIQDAADAGLSRCGRAHGGMINKVQQHAPTPPLHSHDHNQESPAAVSYTHLRAHETPEHLVCRLLLEK